MKQRATAITVLFICGLIGLGIGQGLRVRYEHRLANTIWPTNLPDVSVQAGTSDNALPTVLFLGDSRIADWGLPRIKGWNVVNAGVRGGTSGQIRMAAPKLLDAFHPQAVVIEVGINDLKYLGLRPREASVVVPLVESNTTSLIMECTNQGSRVILLEVWPPGPVSLARRMVWSGMVMISVDQVNSWLQTLTAQSGTVRVVDIFQSAGLKLRPDQYRDTLHLAPGIYSLLTPALERELAGLSSEK